MLCRRDEADRAPHAVVAHLAQRVGEQRMPVAHPHIDRQRMALVRKTRAQPFGLTPGQLRDRRNAAEVLVVAGHFLHAMRRHPSPAEYVGEKGPDVVEALRAAERHDEDRVEHLHSGYRSTGGCGSLPTPGLSWRA